VEIVSEEDVAETVTAAPGIGMLPDFTIPRIVAVADVVASFCTGEGWT